MIPSAVFDLKFVNELVADAAENSKSSAAAVNAAKLTLVPLYWRFVAHGTAAAI